MYLYKQIVCFLYILIYQNIQSYHTSCYKLQIFSRFDLRMQGITDSKLSTLPLSCDSAGVSNLNRQQNRLVKHGKNCENVFVTHIFEMDDLEILDSEFLANPIFTFGFCRFGFIASLVYLSFMISKTWPASIHMCAFKYQLPPSMFMTSSPGCFATSPSIGWSNWFDSHSKWLDVEWNRSPSQHCSKPSSFRIQIQL